VWFLRLHLRFQNLNEVVIYPYNNIPAHTFDIFLRLYVTLGYLNAVSAKGWWYFQLQIGVLCCSLVCFFAPPLKVRHSRTKYQQCPPLYNISRNCTNYHQSTIFLPVWWQGVGGEKPAQLCVVDRVFCAGLGGDMDARFQGHPVRESLGEDPQR